MTVDAVHVSTLRLNLMRGVYLLICLGMGSIMWPLLLDHPRWDVMHGVACAMLGALSLTAALGVRYPLQMLPLLLFELAWKLIWLLTVALPLYLSGSLDAANMSTVIDCMFGVVICPLVIPWRYVWSNYVRKGGDRWATPRALTQPSHG